MDLSKRELVEQAERYKQLARMGEDSPLDKLRWNFKQWYVINSKAKNVYMSGPNQVGGKTTTAQQCLKMWATNVYPEGYTGIRFGRPVEILALSVTNDKTQEVLSDRLFGRFDQRGSGNIPASWFDPVEDLVPAPGSQRGQLSMAFLPCFGENGEILGRSVIRFMAYSMGDERLQGSTPDIVIADEEPHPKPVFDELEARLNKTRGILRIFANPTRGNTECRQKFKRGDNPDYEYVEYNIEDCEHLTEDHVAELNRKYPPGSAERMLRLYGEVPEEEGLLFPIAVDNLTVEDFPLQPDYQVVIGIDIPHTHNGYFACALVSRNPKDDVVTVHTSWKKAGAARTEHAQKLRSLRGTQIEIAWPHDMNRADGGNRRIIDAYRQDFGLNFQKRHAHYREDGKESRAVRPILDDIYNRMLEGRFQIVRGPANREFLDELRSYKTKDGKIARRQDDHIIDSVVKAMMVLERQKPYGSAIAELGAPVLPRVDRHRDFFTGRKARTRAWKRTS